MGRRPSLLGGGFPRDRWKGGGADAAVRVSGTGSQPQPRGSRQQGEDGCREGLSSHLFLTLSTQLGPDTTRPRPLPALPPPSFLLWTQHTERRVPGARRMNGCFRLFPPTLVPSGIDLLHVLSFLLWDHPPQIQRAGK